MGQAASPLGFLHEVVFQSGYAAPLVALGLALHLMPLLLHDVYSDLRHHGRNQIFNANTEFNRVSQTLAHIKELQVVIKLEKPDSIAALVGCKLVALEWVKHFGRGLHVAPLAELLIKDAPLHHLQQHLVLSA